MSARRIKRSVRFKYKELNLLERIIDAYTGREMDDYEAEEVQKLLNKLYTDDSKTIESRIRYLKVKGYKVSKEGED